MAQTRKITYASVQSTTGATTIFSAATTWSQLKSEVPDIEAKSLNMKPWVKGTDEQEGYSLLNNPQLPESDFTIYFLVNKNDSGL